MILENRSSFNTTGLYPKSILFKSYLSGVKKFSDLDILN